MDEENKESQLEPIMVSEQSCEQLDAEGEHEEEQNGMRLVIQSDRNNAEHEEEQNDSELVMQRDENNARVVSSEPQPCNVFRGERPTLGMVFQSETQAYEYYNLYGKSMGFSVRRSKMVMRKDKTVTRRVFCCSKEGFRCKHPRGDPMRPRPLTRTGCKARLDIYLQGGKYIVNEFVEEHNHALARPSEAHMLRSQCKNQDPQAFSIDDIMSYLGEEGGAPQELNLVQGDSSAYLQRWCCEILKKAQEDKKKIRELSTELQRERRQCATYKEQLNIVLKEMEDHTNHLSKQVENIVYNVKELEPRGSKEVRMHFRALLDFGSVNDCKVNDPRYTRKELQHLHPLAWCMFMNLDRSFMVQEIQDLCGSNSCNSMHVIMAQLSPPHLSLSSDDYEATMDDLYEALDLQNRYLFVSAFQQTGS